MIWEELFLSCHVEEKAQRNKSQLLFISDTSSAFIRTTWNRLLFSNPRCFQLQCCTVPASLQVSTGSIPNIYQYLPLVHVHENSMFPLLVLLLLFMYMWVCLCMWVSCMRRCMQRMVSDSLEWELDSDELPGMGDGIRTLVLCKSYIVLTASLTV